MAKFFVLFLAILTYSICATYGLECYTGYSVIRGRTVGTDTKTCASESDKCYKANADISTITKFKLSGCSTYRCMLSPNGCTTQIIAGQSIELCCCNTDLCNAPESNVESIAKGLLTHLSGNNNNEGHSGNYDSNGNSNGGSSGGGFMDSIKNALSGGHHDNGGGSSSNGDSSGGSNSLTDSIKGALSKFGR